VKEDGGRLAAVWIWVAAGLVIVLLAFAFTIRIPQPGAVLAPKNPPAIRLVDPVAIAGTLLLDPAPLFLPSAFSSSRVEYTPREPGGAFAGFAFKKLFSDARLDLYLPPAATIPASPASLGEAPPGAPFIGFGRGEFALQPLAKRGAYVEISEAGSGRKVLDAALVDASPPSGLPWQPMEFLAAVDAAGLVGPLSPVSRSGVDEVDEYFGRYLSDVFRIGQRLAPGMYRVSVGP
jgi:hypothetical protein